MPEKSVFLSYRRTNIAWALAIYQNLTQHGYDVFFDYESIKVGDFSQVILGNLKARAHFVVLLTPSALERCANPDDWLRLEIETALDEKRNIVPLMFEGFSFGDAAIKPQLTGKLALVSHYNALRVPSDFFPEAMGRLRERLNVELTGILHPISKQANVAAKSAQKAADAAPTVTENALSAEECFENGYKLHQEDKDLEAAYMAYSQAIQLNPKSSMAYNNRAWVNLDRQLWLDAIDDCNKAIELDELNHYAYNNRGVARQSQGDLVAAIQDYSEAIRLKSDDAIAYNNRGNARQAQGDLVGAMQDYSEAIQLKPDDVEVYNNRGIARQAQGDLAGALQDCNEAIRLKPNYANAYISRGVTYFKQGLYQHAAVDFEQALKINPNDELARKNLELIRANL